jgi:hypothetical protein
MQPQNGHAAAIPSSSDEPSPDELTAAPSLPLVAFHGRDPLVAPEIEPAPRWRDWMNATQGRSANRCLPLLMANEAGWVLKNPAAFTATWNGSDGRDAILVEYEDACPANRRLASSHFGSGVLTFAVPYLFRTPPRLQPAGPRPRQLAQGRDLRARRARRDRLGGGDVHDELEDHAS